MLVGLLSLDDVLDLLADETGVIERLPAKQRGQVAVPTEPHWPAQIAARRSDPGRTAMVSAEGGQSAESVDMVCSVARPAALRSGP